MNLDAIFHAVATAEGVVSDVRCNPSSPMEIKLADALLTTTYALRELAIVSVALVQQAHRP